ncbi:Maf family protein [Isachenkonia alkalipeptolytica]|uniref:dTTP/UTP pyrophosphatase n=1 Tax=Isachenkonia alkalipeptolytica TaxID=2565777 RepID=A0AA43XN35_9CLOT|nr:Maf family protein [Isachenkonia alkalipeptolytica]NBG88955.1 septum formation protein Maf [Isachenkonia alkalipeptolytica]
MGQFLILASKSPRRKEILQDLGFQLIVQQSDVDETCDGSYKSLEEKVISIARKKAQAVASRTDRSGEKTIVLASDTMVFLNDEVLEKPKSRREAYIMLAKLSNKKHRVITVTVIIDDKKQQTFENASKTDVYFKDLDKKAINGYLDHNQYRDKAGAYGIQNNGDLLIDKIDGDYFNVMGLSASTVTDYFKKYHNEVISTERLFDKHKNLIKKFRSDGDSNE